MQRHGNKGKLYSAQLGMSYIHLFCQKEQTVLSFHAAHDVYLQEEKETGRYLQIWLFSLSGFVLTHVLKYSA